MKPAEDTILTDRSSELDSSNAAQHIAKLPAWFRETTAGRAIIQEINGKTKKHRLAAIERLAAARLGEAELLLLVARRMEGEKNMEKVLEKLRSVHIENIEASAAVQNADYAQRLKVDREEQLLRATSDPSIGEFTNELDKLETDMRDLSGDKLQFVARESILMRFDAITAARFAVEALRLVEVDDLEARLQQLRAAIPELESQSVAVPRRNPFFN
ncbi:MAG: hypothetical protein ACR2L2_07950 [Acidobacteriota bacterium]